LLGVFENAASCDLDSRDDGLERIETKMFNSRRIESKQSKAKQNKAKQSKAKRKAVEKEKKRRREEPARHVGGTIYGAPYTASHLSFMCHNHDSIMTAH
jgi:hypothetical protein